MNSIILIFKTRIKIEHAILLSIFLFSVFSCAPTSKTVRTTPENEEIISQIDSISIINDAYLALDPLFAKDYVLIDASITAESYILEETKKQLELKGYFIDYGMSPMVGGFAPTKEPIKVANSRKDEKYSMTPPFYLDNQINDEEYLNSLSDVNTSVLSAIKVGRTKLKESNDSIYKSLKLISDRLGNDKALIVIGDGKIVPTGKSLGQAFTVGILTTTITLGMVTYFVYNVSYLDSYIALLDLKTGELIWTNEIRLSSNPTKLKFYEKYWGERLFYHFPLKN